MQISSLMWSLFQHQYRYGGAKNWSKKIRLNIQKGKTKYMANFQSDEIIVIQNDILDRYKCLGQTVMMKKTKQIRKEDVIKIKAGYSSFCRFKDVLSDYKLPVCNSNYDMWAATTAELKQRSITSRRAMERRMLNIRTKDKLRISEIMIQAQAK